jgi:hypothetical protein
MNPRQEAQMLIAQLMNAGLTRQDIINALIERGVKPRTDPCFECGAPAECHHHVVPRVFGGTKTVPLCDGCHSKAHGVDGRKAWVSSTTSAAMVSMREQGIYTGGPVRYGYRVGDGGKLTPDPGEQAVIAAVVELRAKGLSLRAVSAALAERGMLTRGGRPFAANAVARIEADALEAAGVAFDLATP